MLKYIGACEIVFSNNVRNFKVSTARHIQMVHEMSGCDKSCTSNTAEASEVNQNTL